MFTTDIKRIKLYILFGLEQKEEDLPGLIDKRPVVDGHVVVSAAVVGLQLQLVEPEQRTVYRY
jgi:hypothetical protein